MFKMHLLSVISLLLSLSMAFDIRDFGAVADDDSLSAEQINGQAIMDAIVAANYTDTDRTVFVPNMTFHCMPVWATHINNITFQIDGTIMLSKRHHKIPLRKEKKIRDMFFFEDVDGLTVQGVGTVDGQGYMWWIRELLS